MDTTTYIVAATLPDGTRRLVMDDIPNYDEAVEIWHRLDAERDPDRVRVYCVRSEDDPAWHGLLRVDADINRRAYTAQRDARNAELARTIRWALREGGCRSFDQVVADVTRSLRDRGYHVPAHWQIEAAVKNRVTVARCRKDGKYDRDHCDRAWFWPRREGTLGEHACPTCGGDLSQTSLAYGQQFHRITKQEPARRVAEPNAGLLSAQTGTYKAGE